MQPITAMRAFGKSELSDEERVLLITANKLYTSFWKRRNESDFAINSRDDLVNQILESMRSVIDTDAEMSNLNQKESHEEKAILCSS